MITESEVIIGQNLLGNVVCATCIKQEDGRHVMLDITS